MESGVTLDGEAGVAELADFRGWENAWTRPDRRPIYEWAHDHLTLPPSYAVQGRFDVSLSRPMIAVFDGIQNPMVRRIRFRKPPRYGGSMIADIAIPWIVCNDPGPIGWHWQSDDDAKGHMKQKALSLWKSCKPFKAMLPPDRHDKTNTEIYFGPFFLRACGANLNNLQGVGLRWVFNDEVWLPVWQDLYQHAVYRTRDFERAGSYKITDVSQAGNENDVEDRNWRAGNQAVWNYRATNGKLVPLLFGGKRDDGSRWGLIWNEDAKRQDGTWNKARAVETARYACKETGHEYFDKPDTIAGWNRDGAYVDHNPEVPIATRSYGVNALLNRSLASLVEEKIDAMELAARGDMALMRDFKQKAECIPWSETHLTVSLSTILVGYKYADYAAGEKWDGETHRVMTMDRQHGIGGDTPHRWAEIRAFKPGGESRQLFFGRVNTKEAARELQLKYGVRDKCVWQDAAFEKHEVFAECIEYGWMAVFGSDQASWAHYTRRPGEVDPVKVSMPYSPIQWSEVGGSKQRASYLLFSVEYTSDVLSNLLAGRGVKWEHPDDWSEEHQEHLKAKQKTEKRPGVFKWETVKQRDDHGFDTSKMAVAYALVSKLIAIVRQQGPAKPDRITKADLGAP